MATSAVTEESIITLRYSCDIQTESVPRVRESYRYQVKQSSRRRKWTLRTIGSRSLLLIPTWLFVSLSAPKISHSYTHLEKVNPDYPWIKGEALLGIGTLSISSRIVSLLAEVVISGYKLVSWSLKSMWFISIVGSIISIC